MKYLCASLVGLILGASAALAGPLHDAAREGDVARTKQLLDQGAVRGGARCAGEPALLIASLAGHADVVALLLERAPISKFVTRADLRPCTRRHMVETSKS